MANGMEGCCVQGCHEAVASPGERCRKHEIEYCQQVAAATATNPNASLVYTPDKPLAKVETRLPLESAPEPGILGVIHAAIERGADATEAYAIYREERAQQAMAEFIAAKGRFKAECPAIKKTRLNTQFKVDGAGQHRPVYYAPLEEIQAIVDPILERHDFTYGWREEPEPDSANTRLVFVLSHAKGHREEYPVRLVTPDRGGFSPPQGWQIARTYAMRAGLVAGLGVRIIGEDNDGNTGEPTTITAEQMRTLNDLLIELADLRGTQVEDVQQTFCRAFGVERIGDLAVGQYAKAEAQINTRLEKERKAAQ